MTTSPSDHTHAICRRLPSSFSRSRYAAHGIARATETAAVSSAPSGARDPLRARCHWAQALSASHKQLPDALSPILTGFSGPDHGARETELRLISARRCADALRTPGAIRPDRDIRVAHQENLPRERLRPISAQTPNHVPSAWRGRRP